MKLFVIFMIEDQFYSLFKAKEKSTNRAWCFVLNYSSASYSDFLKDHRQTFVEKQNLLTCLYSNCQHRQVGWQKSHFPLLSKTSWIQEIKKQQSNNLISFISRYLSLLFIKKLRLHVFQLYFHKSSRICTIVYEKSNSDNVDTTRTYLEYSMLNIMVFHLIKYVDYTGRWFMHVNSKFCKMLKIFLQKTKFLCLFHLPNAFFSTIAFCVGYGHARRA